MYDSNDLVAAAYRRHIPWRSPRLLAAKVIQRLRLTLSEGGAFIAWGGYDALIRAVYWPMRWARGQRRGFSGYAVRTGAVGTELAERVTVALQSAELLDMEPDDHAPGYVYHRALAPLLPSLKGRFRYYEIEMRQFPQIRAVLDALDPVIAECLGTPWQTLNIKAWQTMPTSGDFGSNAWHTDGFPKGMHKALVYLCDAGPDTGTTEIRLPDGATVTAAGPSGSFIFFASSLYVHRGLPPKANIRTVLEITFARAFTRSPEPVYGGRNSAYPRYPWLRLPKLGETRLGG